MGIYVEKFPVPLVLTGLCLSTLSRVSIVLDFPNHQFGGYLVAKHSPIVFGTRDDRIKCPLGMGQRDFFYANFTAVCLGGHPARPFAPWSYASDHTNC